MGNEEKHTTAAILAALHIPYTPGPGSRRWPHGQLHLDERRAPLPNGFSRGADATRSPTSRAVTKRGFRLTPGSTRQIGSGSAVPGWRLPVLAERLPVLVQIQQGGVTL